jgi:hypothetical protein
VGDGNLGVAKTLLSGRLPAGFAMIGDAAVIETPFLAKLIERDATQKLECVVSVS